MTLIADTPEKIAAWRALALRSALSLELIGLKRRGRSAYSIIKQEYGLRGSKQAVFDQFTKILKEKNILVTI